MSRIAKMLAKRAALVEEMEGIAEAASTEDRDLSAAEQKAFDEREEEMKKLDAQISVEKRLEAARAATAKPVATAGNVAKDLVPAQPKYRYSKMKAFKGPTAEADAYATGKFLQATILRGAPGMDEVVKSASEWCRDNGVGIQKAANEGSNSSGGYLVPTQFEQSIIDLRESYGTFRQYVPVIPMAGDTLSKPKRTGGLTAYFVDESGLLTESDKTWGQVKLVAKKLACLSRISSEISEDAIINIADDLAAEMAYAFAVKEDSVGWNGTGISTDGGIIGVRTKFAAGVGSFVGAVDAASGHDTFAELDAADFRKVMAKLPKYARKNAKWYGSTVAWDTAVLPIIMASGGLTGQEMGAGFPKRFLGYEWVDDQTLPTDTTDISDTAMILFGDLGLSAKMGQRRGITLMQSDQRYFEYDQIGLRATERFDINVHDVGDATTAGPIVALMAE